MERGTILAVAIAAAVIAGAGTAGAAMALSDPASPAQTAPATAEGPNSTITVTAVGSESAAPDKAVLEIAVRKTAPEPNDARALVADNVSSVKTALEDLDIPADNIRTTDYRIGQEHREPVVREEQSEPGYYAQQIIEVHLSDVDDVGSVIDASVEAGATDVHDVRFTLSDETRNDLRNDALEDAMTQADSQAQTLADSSDLTIVGPQTIDADTRHTPIVRYTAEMAGAAGDTSIDAGPVSVETHVTVTYETSR